MIVRKADGTCAALDFREKAPRSALSDIFLDSTGNVTDRITRGCMSAGVPGTVAGLIQALDDYGTMKLKDVIEPAIILAKNGFEIDERLRSKLIEYENDLRPFPSTVKLFFKNDSLYQEGDTLKQSDLAATLIRIQSTGIDGFYKGETARLITDEMRRGGGLITEDDLAEYKPIIRKPLIGTYRGYDIITMPPSSSGGLCLIEIMNIIEKFNLDSLGYHTSQSVHIISEAMKRAYADRAEYMGDPDYVAIPVDRLISKEYASLYSSKIDPYYSAPSESIKARVVREHPNTTHYSVVDSSGNCVAVTYTLNDLFGSQVVVDGAGFFLNNEMDDFSSKPGVANSYGLTGGYANSIEPGKRPLSSMAPTIILKDGKPILILGARGGSRIITGVLQVILNVLDYRMDIENAVNAPRFHHQWIPDELIYEKDCFNSDVVLNLQERGYHTKEVISKIGALEIIYFDSDSGWIYGVPDFREGGVAVGY